MESEGTTEVGTDEEFVATPSEAKLSGNHPIVVIKTSFVLDRSRMILADKRAGKYGQIADVRRDGVHGGRLVVHCTESTALNVADLVAKQFCDAWTADIKREETPQSRKPVAVGNSPYNNPEIWARQVEAYSTRRTVLRSPQHTGW